MSQTPIVLYVVLVSSSLNVYCVLKKGEPGTGEKGERGMDGLPGLKVRDELEIYTSIICCCFLNQI